MVKQQACPVESLKGDSGDSGFRRGQFRGSILCIDRRNTSRTHLAIIKRGVSVLKPIPKG